MSDFDRQWHRTASGDTPSPPFAPEVTGSPVASGPASPGSLRLAGLAFLAGLITAVPSGTALGWVLHRVMVSDCYGDGWCELGAAVFGLGFGVVAGLVIYVVAGVMTVRRYRPSGRRLVPSLVHVAVPIGVITLGQLAGAVLS